MVKLTAKPPLETGLLFEAGGARLLAIDTGRLTSIAPYAGQADAVSQVLQAEHGLVFPAPGRVSHSEAARCVWWGRAQAMLAGPEPAAGLGACAALTDQSDGWAMLVLEGAGARAVLSRLTPLDIRTEGFPAGHTARTELAHMMASVTCAGPDRFELLVMRSMAQTARRALETAVKSIAAQG
ncbi:MULTISPECIES: sarcosine oxidase subunit gamma [Actibacterium]|uniref:Sarcosine oxidase subunit gamma n=1 Tax=Actibacterium naphthalenivorans TaxID=1614693 RepID=A0A840CKY2_9RHOB|nr:MULTISPECIES: sarcosine oxidase subunit gamma family protein [Actibacterium]MBB4023386.1 sarcosine oxidase subunit gamma [Actibacterium naphthalenivorans]